MGPPRGGDDDGDGSDAGEVVGTWDCWFSGKRQPPHRIHRPLVWLVSVSFMSTDLHPHITDFLTFNICFGLFGLWVFLYQSNVESPQDGSALVVKSHVRSQELACDFKSQIRLGMWPDSLWTVQGSEGMDVT